MIVLDLTGNERIQFQYILPVQGSLQTLELVEKILEKVKINDVKDMNEITKIKFEEIEFNFIKEMIKYLDSQKQLNYSSLSLLRKILNRKQEA